MISRVRHGRWLQWPPHRRRAQMAHVQLAPDCGPGVRAVCLLLILCAVSLDACRSGDALPEPASKTYREAVAALYTGLAAIQASADLVAEENMRRVTEL